MPRTTDGEQPTLSAAELTSLVATLQVELIGLKSRVSEGEVENASLRETVLNLAHENELLKRRIYGNKTERTRTSELQLALGNLLDDEKRLQKELDEAVAAARGASGEGAEAQTSEKRHKKPGGRRDLSASDLQMVPFDILDPDLEKTAKRIGFDTSLHLMFRRGGWMVLAKRTAKYEVPGKDGPTVLGVPVPRTLFPRGLLHSSAIAHIIVQKFGLGVPHHRLEQHLESQCVSLDRGTMCRYTEEAGGALGSTIVEAMWRHALTNACVISTDATSGMVQPEPRSDGLRQACKKGHLFTAVVDCDYVLFAYSERHTQEFVKKLFGGFKGYLQSDASNVYDVLERGPARRQRGGRQPGRLLRALPPLFLRGCDLQIRRRRAGIASPACDLRGRRCVSQAAARQAQGNARRTCALIDSFFDWAKSVRGSVQGRNLATKAIGYALNQEHELRRVLEDGRLPLDNTRSERSLRKIVVGRKNWMFYGSDTHAESAAALFTIIGSCRLHRLDPEQYLDDVLRVLPYWPKERYLELTPNNWRTTREKLLPAELERPVGTFTVPAA